MTSGWWSEFVARLALELRPEVAARAAAGAIFGCAILLACILVTALVVGFLVLVARCTSDGEEQEGERPAG